MPEERIKTQQKTTEAQGLNYTYNVTVSGGFSGTSRKDASGDVSVKDNKGVFTIKATDKETGKSVSLTAQIKEGLDGKYHVTATDGKSKIEVKDADRYVKPYFQESATTNPQLMAMRDDYVLGSLLLQSLYGQKYRGDEFKPSAIDGSHVGVSFDRK